MRSFGDSVFTGRITISEADKRKSILLDVISNFENKIRPRSKADKEKKGLYENPIALYKGQELTFNAFKTGIFRLKSTK